MDAGLLDKSADMEEVRGVAVAVRNVARVACCSSPPPTVTTVFEAGSEKNQEWNFSFTSKTVFRVHFLQNLSMGEWT